MPATSDTPARDQLESCFKKSGQPHLANLVQLTEGDLSNWRPDWNTAAEAALGSAGLLKCFGEIFARLEAGAARAQDQVLARLNAVTADRDSLRTRYENYDEEWSSLQATLAERDATIKILVREMKTSNIKEDVSTVKDPAPFTGEGKDTKAIQVEFLHWAHCIRTRWRQLPHRFSSERVKMEHIYGLLSGEAWTMNYTNAKAVQTAIDDDDLPFRTATDTLEYLERTYVVHDLNADAKTDILDFRQGDLAFPMFLTKFNTLADQAGWSLQQKIDGLITRVHPQIRALHKNAYEDPPAGDWNAWAHRFMKYAQKIRENIALNNHDKSHHRIQGNSGTQAQRQTIPSGDAMDLDALLISRLDPTVLQYRLDNNLCKRCGQPGHYAKNCDGKGNVVPDRFTTRGRGTGRGRGSSSGRGYGGRGTYQPAYPSHQQHLTAYPHHTSQASAYTQQLRSADNLQYPAPPSLTPPSTRAPTPSPSPHPQQQQGFVFGPLEGLPSTQQTYFNALQTSGKA